jgi:hypothetical protein
MYGNAARQAASPTLEVPSCGAFGVFFCGGATREPDYCTQKLHESEKTETIPHIHLHEE